MPALVLWSCVPLLLSAPSLCLCWAVLEICLYSHFKGVLAGFPCWMYVCIACVLCVACVAFVCVRCLAALWLDACLLLFSSSLPSFLSLLPCLSAFRLSSSVCPLCLPCLFLCLCGLYYFLFPFRLYRQNERARRVGASSLRVL